VITSNIEYTNSGCMMPFVQQSCSTGANQGGQGNQGH
jgi:hypothetical protein